MQNSNHLLSLDVGLLHSIPAKLRAQAESLLRQIADCPGNAPAAQNWSFSAVPTQAPEIQLRKAHRKS